MNNIEKAIKELEDTCLLIESNCQLNIQQNAKLKLKLYELKYELERSKKAIDYLAKKRIYDDKKEN